MLGRKIVSDTTIRIPTPPSGAESMRPLLGYVMSLMERGMTETEISILLALARDLVEREAHHAQ